MTPAVIRLDARDRRLRQLIPMAADRIEAYATAHQPEVDAKEFAAGMVGRVWTGDVRVLLLVIIDPATATLHGHLLAIHEMFGAERWVSVVQVDAGPRAKDARFEAVEVARGWARGLAVTKVLLSANGDGKQWEKRLGAKFYRHVLMLPIPAPLDLDRRAEAEDRVAHSQPLGRKPVVAHGDGNDPRPG